MFPVVDIVVPALFPRGAGVTNSTGSSAVGSTVTSGSIVTSSTRGTSGSRASGPADSSSGVKSLGVVKFINASIPDSIVFCRIMYLSKCRNCT